MALWGSTDTTANKPKYDNGSDVFGITAGEVGATTGDNVVAINVTAGGTGYSKGAAISVSGGGGSDLAGTISVTDGAITGVTISDGGSGYPSAPTVTAPTGNSATFEVILGEGSSTIGHTGWAKRTVGTGGRAGRVFWEVLVAGGMADGAGDEDVATPDA